MSARVKVAREAVFDAMIEHGPDGHTDGHDKITAAALDAADSVMFSESAIERAAEAVRAASREWGMPDNEAISQYYARAVVAALREEA
ncbi:hypothetical protein [Paenarthrobacter sp. NPDC018779]|uniref:hypothetical protein n=1 Tax=Paenarthrobacter sp. NPDC018779 TaxID=3364375 RepID=UPI0037CAEC59